MHELVNRAVESASLVREQTVSPSIDRNFPSEMSGERSNSAIVDLICKQKYHFEKRMEHQK